MVKKDDRDKEKALPKSTIVAEKRVLIGLIWNCAAELKLILTALLLLCSFATLLQFLPSRFFPFYYPTYTYTTLPSNCPPNVTVAVVATPPLPVAEVVLDNGVVKRSFNPVGTAAYNFILVSAYRGGPNTFAIIGLSSKPLHVYGRPSYTCEYHSNKENDIDDGNNIDNGSNNETVVVSVRGRKILPDWGYGRVYTTIVINCTFPDTSIVSTPTVGGQLILKAAVNGGFDAELDPTDTILALTEPANSWNLSKYTNTPPKYDYLYCGSPIYGNLSPQRVREWIAYHVRLFGERSHFVIYDAGGVHPEVLEVLKPWMELGYVTLQDVREQERFDAYYHNQFAVVNDCLHRYRFDAKWMFFFDVDEFVYLAEGDTFEDVMESVGEYSMFTIEQIPMSNQLCLLKDAGKTSKKWGFEKLVYKNVKKVARRDRKYAIQPRNVFATGVHISQNYQGNYLMKTGHLMKYYHYHGTVAQRREPCRQFDNGMSVVADGIPYVQDTNMMSIAPLVKSFELKTIGSRLESTRQ
ncbi:galactan beta-1,4-galactosyltransferase GALS3-like [Silene latifolia]|uniref:galactan beta-1,4-galactosyltransferase GALS3-like n=1 Tax=Silene latifolia TaxID=37657 RepID=UPI003D77BD2F